MTPDRKHVKPVVRLRLVLIDLPDPLVPELLALLPVLLVLVLVLVLVLLLVLLLLRFVPLLLLPWWSTKGFRVLRTTWAKAGGRVLGTTVLGCPLIVTLGGCDSA